MRNHFHLALETPLPNLAEGLHWLLGTFAVRFNRFRKEQGHVFQGRYRALLIEDAAALTRVAGLHPSQSSPCARGPPGGRRLLSVGQFETACG